MAEEQAEVPNAVFTLVFNYTTSSQSIQHPELEGKDREQMKLP